MLILDILVNGQKHVKVRLDQREKDAVFFSAQFICCTVLTSCSKVKRYINRFGTQWSKKISTRRFFSSKSPFFASSRTPIACARPPQSPQGTTLTIHPLYVLEEMSDGDARFVKARRSAHSLRVSPDKAGDIKGFY